VKPIALVRVGAFIPFLNVLGSIGMPIERRLNESHIPAGLLGDPENLLPLPHLLTFLARNAQAEGLPDLGLRAAVQTRISGLGLFGSILVQSASLSIALEKTSRLIPLYNSGQRVWVDSWQGQARICHVLQEDSGPGRKYANQFTTLLIIDLVRQAAGAAWLPREIHLERGVDDPAAYEMLGVRLRVSDFAAVIADPVLLGQPMLATRQCESHPADISKLALGAPPDGFVESLRQVIGIYMRDHMIGIDHISAVIGLGSRTLQRRLQERGLDYTELVAEARLTAARKLLSDPGIAVTDIAHELGYSDAANFTRAFRKWTGLAPSAYRAGAIWER
jgi:AraC-like DNA-binding protein